MRRLYLFAALFLLTPVVCEAQPRLMVAGGVTTPSGDLADVAKAGYHAQVGLHIGIPTLPVGFRLDGANHVLGETGAAADKTKVLAGSISMVYVFPGIGLQPYVLGGFGKYRVDQGLGVNNLPWDSGYHGGFGVVLGGLGLGAFAEIRYVQISRDTNATARLIPVTFGVRF